MQLHHAGMERSTIRELQTRCVKDERDLARQLDQIKHSKTLVALQHERAQTAFMKRYSALLKRKTGSLLPQRGSVPSKQADLQVSGASIRNKTSKTAPSGSHEAGLSAVYESNGGEKMSSFVHKREAKNTDPQKPARLQNAFPASQSKRHLPTRPRGVVSRSAPSSRPDAGLPLIRELSKQSQQWSSVDNQHSVSGFCWGPPPPPEKQVRKAWSPDLRVLSYSPETAGSLQREETVHDLTTDELSSTKSTPIRGILVKKHNHSFNLCGGHFDDLQKDFLMSNKRRSSVPTTANFSRTENKPHLKKQVSFLESQVEGHEADGDNPPRCLAGRSRGLNVVTLASELDETFGSFEHSRGVPIMSS